MGRARCVFKKDSEGAKVDALETGHSASQTMNFLQMPFALPQSSRIPSLNMSMALTNIKYL